MLKKENFIIDFVWKDTIKFLSRIKCDADGWLLQINKEPPYQTYFHLFPPGQVLTLQLLGDMIVR
jgi:hypothetical protein